MFIYLNYIFIPIPAEIHKNCLFAIGTIVFMTTSPENSLSDNPQDKILSIMVIWQPNLKVLRAEHGQGTEKMQAWSTMVKSLGTEHIGLNQTLHVSFEDKEWLHISSASFSPFVNQE